MQINQISVVVPVRNESGNVASLITEIDTALMHITHEIIYVDDGSTDNTYSQLKSLQMQFTQLKIVRHAHSCGQSTAVRSKMLRDDTPDTGCGLKLFKRDAFLDLPYFDHMHRFLPALIKRRGGKSICASCTSQS